MNRVIRSLMVGLATFAACWYVYWVPVAIALEIGHGRFRGMWIIRILGSIAAAGVVGQYSWRHKSWAPQGLVSCIIVGGIVMGGVGFSLGWFGPMIVDPGSQGPVIAIVTGPVGFLVGSFAGALYWGWRGRKRQREMFPITVPNRAEKLPN